AGGTYHARRRRSHDDKLNRSEMECWRGRQAAHIPLAQDLSRRGVARHADVTRHHAGDTIMTIPFFPHRVQGLGASRDVLMWTSPAEGTATAPQELTCTSSPLTAATALTYLAS